MRSVFCAFVFCAFSCTVFAVPHGIPEVFKNAAMKCKTDMNMDASILVDYFHGQKDVAEEKVKCFFKCIFEGLGWMDENGNISPKEESGLPDDYIKYSTECKDVTGTNDCDKAFKFHICFMKKVILKQ